MRECLKKQQDCNNDSTAPSKLPSGEHNQEDHELVGNYRGSDHGRRLYPWLPPPKTRRGFRCVWTRKQIHATVLESPPRRVLEGANRIFGTHNGASAEGGFP